MSGCRFHDADAGSAHQGDRITELATSPAAYNRWLQFLIPSDWRMASTGALVVRSTA